MSPKASMGPDYLMRDGSPSSFGLIARSLVQLAPVDINPLGIPLSEERQRVRDVVYLGMGIGRPWMFIQVSRSER